MAIVAMHVARLCRSQADLQSHRNWLRVFITSTKLNTHQQRSSSTTYSSTRPIGTRIQKTSQTSYSKPDPRLRPQAINHAVNTHDRLELRDAINAYDIEKVAKSYGSFPDKTQLGVQDLSSIGQCLHYAVRLYNQTPEHQKRPEVMEKILDFITQFMGDIQGKKLAPAPHAYKHILGALKEARSQDSGIQFWQWLEAQDDQFLSHDVYAAAIELLATGDMPLSGLEELYSTCLTRFPGTFLAYHLSPGAIVSDRDRDISITDVPMLLLQAITTARLLRGDTLNAYMALDTALRLRPANIPQRFFNLFMDERPLSEGFTVLAIACRSGQPVGSSLFKRHLAALRHSIVFTSLQSHICIIRAMITSICLHLGAGGQLKSNSISELIIAITRIFRLPGVEKLEPPDRQHLVESALSLIKKTFESFARYGITPHISAFNSIIVNVGGYGQSRSLVDIVLADMKAVGLQPNPVTRRSLVTVGGLLGDSRLVQQSWREIVQARGNEGSAPDDTDFIVLMKAANSTNQVDFAQKQYQAFQAEMSQRQIAKIESHSNALSVAKPDTEQACSADLNAPLLGGLRAVDSDMDTLNELTQGTPDILDFGRWHPPARILPYPDELSIQDEKLHDLYDEFTTEHKQSTISEPSMPGSQTMSQTEASTASEESGEAVDGSPVAEIQESDISLTNVKYGVLRYENWKSINYLLSLSERHDRTHRGSVDRAINAGKRPPQRNGYLTKEEQEKMHHFGLSDIAQRELAEEATATSQMADIRKVKANILRLRGM